MKHRSISYSFIGFVASCLALCLTESADCEERLALAGQVLASDSCQLLPSSWDGMCSAMVIPVSGELALRRRGDQRRELIELDRDGNFSRKLAPGTYRVRLLDPRIQERQVKRSAYRIAPKVIKVRRLRHPQDTPAQLALFIVAHRSRALPAAIGISDGYSK